MSHQPLIKYPRTQHIEGSGLQAGDEDLQPIPFARLAGRHLVAEEKMDGANCAVGFDAAGRLLLQSRGHYLSGGPRERQFELLKSWAGRWAAELYDLLGGRYLMFGEWLFARHSIFYTDLPHFFLEFDIYDRDAGLFLSTPRRAALLAGAPFVASVRILAEGPANSLPALQALIGPSAFVAADHRAQLAAAAAERGIDPAAALREGDPSGLMEGLYIKVEEGGAVTGRYKFVRPGFLQTVLDSGSHWMERPLIPNRLRPGAEIF